MQIIADSVLWAFLALVVGGHIQDLRGQQRCYTLVNPISSTIHIAFQYPSGMLVDKHLVSLDIQPGGRFEDCFNPGTSGAAIVNGPVWQGLPCARGGRLEMGYSSFADSPGTYTLESPPCDDPSGPKASITVDPDIRDSNDDSGNAPGVLEIPQGGTRQLNVKVPDRNSSPTCVQIKNFLNGQQYHNLDCN